MFKMKKNFNLELPSEKTGQSNLKMNQKEKELVSSVAGEKVLRARHQKLENNMRKIRESSQVKEN